MLKSEKFYKYLVQDCSINQRLDKLTLDINNNLTTINEVRSKANDLTLSLETSQNICETENEKLREQLTNLRSNFKEKDGYLKNKLRILEDGSRKKNIRVEGIPGSENERWDVREERLRKVIKDEIYIENVAIERAHRVKRNNDNNENNDQTRKPPTAVANLLHFKDKQDILHEARKFYFKADFSRETLATRKGLWNEVVRWEEEGKFAMINYDRIYSRRFWQKK